MVGSEATKAGVNRAHISSKIGEIGESFPVGLEVITVKVGSTSVYSWNKIREGFPMISSFQEVNMNLHWPRVSPGNIGRVGSLEKTLKNPVIGPSNSAEGNLSVAENPDIDLGTTWMYQYYGRIWTWALRWEAIEQEYFPKNWSTPEW